MKHLIGVFNYLNISNAQNIQRYTINYILRKRNDFFFYISIPHTFSEISKLGFERPEHVKLIPLKYSTRGSLNKLLIDLDGLKKNFKWQKYYVNVIFSNEPYLTHVLVHVFKSSMPFYGTGVGKFPLEEPGFNCGERVVEMKREVYEKKVSEPIIDKKFLKQYLIEKKRERKLREKHYSTSHSLVHVIELV